MPTTVMQLFQSADVSLIETVKWGETALSQKAGVYVVSLSADPNVNAGILESAPISLVAVRLWVEKVPKIELDGQRNPEPEKIAERLSRFWLSDENIVYIGKADKLSKRLKDYYRTKLGDRRPHAGGCWIKTMVNFEKLHIHFAECSKPAEVEGFLLQAFVNGVSKMTQLGLYDCEHPFPFANLEYPKGTRKKHSIGKSKR